MGLKYEYDETGIFFYYFVASVLILVLVPVTLAFVKREVRKLGVSANKPFTPSRIRAVSGYEELSDSMLAAYESEIKNSKKCQAVLRHRFEKTKVSVNYTGIALLALGWLVTAAVLMAIYANPDKEPQLWDPWQILGVGQEASQNEIRKAYRKLSLIHHPDKAELEEGGVENETDSKYIEISKAYKVLTDDDARAKWEEFGSPDGRQGFSVGIALPAWIVEQANAYKVLFVYGAAFGLLLPVLVSRWWTRSKKRGKGNIYNDTIQLFLTDIRSEAMPLKLIIEVLCAAREFDCTDNSNCRDPSMIKALIESVQAAAKERKDVFAPSKRYEKLAWHNKTHALLYAHMLRVPIESEYLQKDQLFVVETAMRLLGALLQVSLSKQWGRQGFLLIRLSALIVQAIYFNDHPLLQLPHVPLDIGVHATQKKRQVSNVAKFLSMIPSERKSLLRTLTDEQLSTVMLIAQRIPKVSIADASFRVVGEAIVIPQCLVTLVVQIKINFPVPTKALQLGEQAAEEPAGKVDLSDSELEKIEAAESKASWQLERKATPTLVHAPYFPLEKKLALWVSLSHGGDNGDLMLMQKVTDIVVPNSDANPPHTIKYVLFKFGTSERPGDYSFKVNVRCDGYVGLDVQKAVTLSVVNPPPDFGKDDFVDDISEPDEDSIAGQLALMRGGQASSSQTSLSQGKVPKEPKVKDLNDKSDQGVEDGVNDVIDADTDSEGDS